MSLNQVLSVMIPAFNEERTLDVIMKHVLEQPEVGEVIAVDDGSTDGTWAIMSRFAERRSGRRQTAAKAPPCAARSPRSGCHSR